jgi:hypothetical protein
MRLPACLGLGIFDRQNDNIQLFLVQTGTYNIEDDGTLCHKKLNLLAIMQAAFKSELQIDIRTYRDEMHT